jgi:hypothetical protein
MKKIFILVIAVCLLSCTSGVENAESNVNIKVEMPENAELGTLSYSMYIVAVDSQTLGGRYAHYCVVTKPETKARLPSVPIGESIIVYAMLFPLEPTDNNALPFFGVTGSPYKAESYPTEPIAVTLEKNIASRDAEGGKFFFINHDYTAWDEVHVFEASNSITFRKESGGRKARVLVAGGGGAGGRGASGGYGGGGGGGAVREQSDVDVSASSYPLTVGAAVSSDDAAQGDSNFNTIITAKGGGKGGSYDEVGKPGSGQGEDIGGGGGGGGSSSGVDPKVGGVGGNNTVFLDGGKGYRPIDGVAGGGGGARSPGKNGDNTVAEKGNGGSGAASNITGEAVYYGGGGGGGGGGIGGNGGGGNGGIIGSGDDGVGYGSGGGGGGGTGFTAPDGGAGKNGVVIVRFPYDIRQFIKTH